MIGRIGLVLGTWLSVSASLAAQSLPSAEPEEVGLSSQRLQRIDQAFQTFVDEGRIAGAEGMILRHGKIASTLLLLGGGV